MGTRITRNLNDAIDNIYEELSSINRYNIIEGVFSVAGNGAVTGLFTQNDYGDDLTVSAVGGYLAFSIPSGFSENTVIQLTMGYEIGGDAINYTWGGYRWSDGKVYVWINVNGGIQVNGNLENASITIKELIPNA
jgi:hypothetical protein